MLAPFDIAADLDTPVSAYLKLSSLHPRFLLESVESGERLGRYSFIGFGAGLDFHLSRDGMRVGDGPLQTRGSDSLLDVLRQTLRDAPTLKPHITDLPFNGGLVGVAGFDLVQEFERLPKPRVGANEFPLAAFFAPASVFVFDHLTRRAALLHAGSESERLALRQEIVSLLRGSLPDIKVGGHYEESHASMSRDQYVNAVNRAKEHIRVGDVYQMVLSICFSGRHDLSPFQVYRALRLLNPSPYMYFLEFGGFSVVGSSPEALVTLQHGRVSLRPIAGTRARGSNEKQDRLHETELLADPKERAEHVMLVDLARNDLGRVAKAGTVKVKPYCSVERYSHVMHLVSGVCGDIRQDKDAFDAFAAAFPAGTLVGAPKLRAMELIDELEPSSRGLYAGTAGYFGHGGNMDQAIAIRTLVFKGDRYSFQAGAGIVADSVPEKEYEEVLAKSKILRRAMEIAKEGL